MAGVKPTWYDNVKAVFEKYKVPEHEWLPIIYAESRGNPKAVNASGSEYSVGLFQINLMAHPEYKGLDLTDPVINAEIAARDFIGPAAKKVEKYSFAPMEQALMVWKEGIRPYWSISARTRFDSIYKSYDLKTGDFDWLAVERKESGSPVGSTSVDVTGGAAPPPEISSFGSGIYYNVFRLVLILLVIGAGYLAGTELLKGGNA